MRPGHGRDMWRDLARVAVAFAAIAVIMAIFSACWAGLYFAGLWST